LTAFWAWLNLYKEGGKNIIEGEKRGKPEIRFRGGEGGSRVPERGNVEEPSILLFRPWHPTGKEFQQKERNSVTLYFQGSGNRELVYAQIRERGELKCPPEAVCLRYWKVGCCENAADLIGKKLHGDGGKFRDNSLDCVVTKSWRGQ